VDIDADEFHRESLKINIPMIKKSLRKRFRDEQIARFGNLHIIYPALSRDNYEQFIKLQLNNLARDMYNQTDLNFEFEPSVNEVIYKEGVYPTQGVRPIYTTINQLLRNNIVRFISQVLISESSIDTLRFGFEKDVLKCKYISENQIIDNKEIRIVLSLNEIRKPKRNNLQAITAVHESGHAVVGYFLLQIIPEVIYSVTTDSDVIGFTYSRSEQDYNIRNQMLNKVATILGGYIAEELIFGKEHLTTGSNSDIEKATNFLSDMYLKHGMGDIPLRVSIPLSATAVDYHNYAGVEDEIKLGIVKAMGLAKDVLLKEKRLLLVMAEHLSNRSSLKKAEIEKIIEAERTETDTVSTIAYSYNYRQSIKEQLDKIRAGQQLPDLSQTQVFLNKKL
jgi:cell division protease FtsH